jgi:hypothetical protein
MKMKNCELRKGLTVDYQELDNLMKNIGNNDDIVELFDNL